MTVGELRLALADLPDDLPVEIFAGYRDLLPIYTELTAMIQPTVVRYKRGYAFVITCKD